MCGQELAALPAQQHVCARARACVPTQLRVPDRAATGRMASVEVKVLLLVASPVCYSHAFAQTLHVTWILSR